MVINESYLLTKVDLLLQTVFRTKGCILSRVKDKSQGFGIVLVTVTILCSLLSIASMLASTPLLRGVVRKVCEPKKKKKVATNVIPVTESSLAEKGL